MSQIVLNNQNQNPLTYFANTPRSIQKRKNCASKPSNMKIINFIKNDGDGSFIVYIKGTRDIIYQVFFSEHLISCTCPDYQKHSVKPICKHMLKLVCLSENMDIFNNILLLSELMNPQYLSRILENILRIIDTKKMERYGNPTNQISIERDDCCSICYADFDNNIAKCIKCSHVFHQECIRRYRAISSNFRYVGGRCPMCRELNSFPQLENYRNYDPWEIYNFPPPAQQDPSPAPPAEAAQEDSPSPIAPVSAPEDPQLEEVEDRVVRQEELLLNERTPNLEFEQNNEIIVFQNDLDNLPIFFENIGEAAAGEAAAPSNPNQNPNQRGPAQAQTTTSTPAPNSEEQERLILDKKIKMLNISLFILNAVSIIITNISKDLSADINPKPNQDNSSSNLI